jgi:large subunit ribosomal protein L7/L12
MDEMKKEVPAKFADLVKNIETMSVLDLHELVKTLESHFGVSAAAVAAPAAGGAAGGEAAEAKDSYTLHLVSAGEAKIGVMKVIKEALGLGLKEAKDMVDGAPVDVKAGLKKAEADALKKSIEEAGGKVELK